MILTILSIVLVAATLPGTVELALLSLAGLFPARRRPPAARSLGEFVVVVPAHDEEADIASCVGSLLASDPELRVVVVADNCSDATADVARAAGADVFERQDADNRGKGHALDFAFTRLLDQGVDAVAVVDADTHVAPDFVARTRAWLESGADAVQCRYSVLDPGTSLRTRLMDVSLSAFNVLRPRGRARLGLSAGIFGNGFALTAETLRAVPYEARSVVEDLEYHLDLVRSGRSVAFADDTEVRGAMPTGGRGAATQRARWEGGRLRMLREAAPGLVGEVLRGRVKLFEPLLELLLLPLSWHVLLLGLAACVPWAPGQWIACCGLAVLALHVVAAVFVGRAGWAGLGALASAPVYVAWKLALAPAIARASRKDTTWVRTERAGHE